MPRRNIQPLVQPGCKYDRNVSPKASTGNFDKKEPLGVQSSASCSSHNKPLTTTVSNIKTHVKFTEMSLSQNQEPMVDVQWKSSSPISLSQISRVKSKDHGDLDELVQAFANESEELIGDKTSPLLGRLMSSKSPRIKALARKHKKRFRQGSLRQNDTSKDILARLQSVLHTEESGDSEECAGADLTVTSDLFETELSRPDHSSDSSVDLLSSYVEKDRDLSENSNVTEQSNSCDQLWSDDDLFDDDDDALILQATQGLLSPVVTLTKKRKSLEDHHSTNAKKLPPVPSTRDSSPSVSNTRDSLQNNKRLELRTNDLFVKPFPSVIQNKKLNNNRLKQADKSLNQLNNKGKGNMLNGAGSAAICDINESQMESTQQQTITKQQYDSSLSKTVGNTGLLSPKTHHKTPITMSSPKVSQQDISITDDLLAAMAEPDEILESQACIGEWPESGEDSLVDDILNGSQETFNNNHPDERGGNSDGLNHSKGVKSQQSVVNQKTAEANTQGRMTENIHSKPTSYSKDPQPKATMSTSYSFKKLNDTHEKKQNNTDEKKFHSNNLMVDADYPKCSPDEIEKKKRDAIMRRNNRLKLKKDGSLVE